LRDSFINKLILYINTVKFLSAKQIFYYFSFYLKKHILSIKYIKKISNDSPNIDYQLPKDINKPIIPSQHRLSQLSFNFLNKTVSFKNDVEWNQSNLSKLFLYNLHYFDFILRGDENLTLRKFREDKILFRSWISNNPVGLKNGWEPYPLSLRIVNWVFYFSKYHEYFNNDQDFKDIYLNNLHQQCEYLSCFIERHIRANHLFKNGKALIFGGYFFKNRKWIDTGEKLLDQELEEQILSDGGHYERSPMYHSLILEDIIDLAALQKSLSVRSKRITQERLEEISHKMLRWLMVSIHPDMEIPLFGDSALHSTLTYEQLFKYYQSTFKKLPGLKKVEQFETLETSGYYIFRSSDQFLIVDGGTLGVDYQPGHAHCDLLSYEYSFNQKRFIVDTGIGEYLNTELRQKARGIIGHNSVMVNHMDQAEIWQAFRMGRRLESPHVKTVSEKSLSVFSGEYENTLSRSNRYHHRREIDFVEERFFHIKDKVTGKRLQSITSFINIHPECKVVLDKDKVRISHSDTIIYILFSELKNNTFIKEWMYIPEFGKHLSTFKIEINPKKIENGYIDYIIVPSRYLPFALDYYSHEKTKK
jgi:uncharacterized heparinase superfamily protein